MMWSMQYAQYTTDSTNITCLVAVNDKDEAAVAMAAKNIGQIH